MAQDYLFPGDLIIAVKKTAKEVIEQAIKDYAEDNAYCLKFYSIVLDITNIKRTFYHKR